MMDSPRITPLSCCQLVEQWSAAADKNIGTDERISLYAKTKIFADYLEFHRAHELCDVFVKKFDELTQMQIQNLINWIVQETKYEKNTSKEVFTGAFSSIDHLFETITKVKGAWGIIDPAGIISGSRALMRSMPKPFLGDKDLLKIIFPYLRTKDLIAIAKYELSKKIESEQSWTTALMPLLAMLYYLDFDCILDEPDYTFEKNMAMNCLAERIKEFRFKSVSEIKEFYGNDHLKIRELDTRTLKKAEDVEIEEISKTFTRLEKLVCAENYGHEITDLSVKSLISMTTLKNLEIQSQNISSFDFLQKLTNLTKLKLTFSDQITSISSLKSLYKLEALSLKDCKFDPASILASLPNLKSLALKGCKKIDDDYNFLKSFTNLTKLNLKPDFGIRCALTYLGFLENLTLLKKLNLGGWCFISSIERLTKLSHLNLGGGNIQFQLSSLKKLPALTKLNLAGNYEFKPHIDILKTLTKLSSLDLSKCMGFSKLDLLKGMTNLTDLNLKSYYHNSVCDLPMINTLKNLRKLALHCKSDDDYTSLKDLENLTSLSFSNTSYDNKINFSGLKSIPNLEYVNFDDWSAFNPQVEKDLLDKGIIVNYIY